MHSTNINTIIKRFHLTLKKEEKYQFRLSFLEWRKTIRNYVPCEMQLQYEIKIACSEISNDDFYWNTWMTNELVLYGILQALHNIVPRKQWMSFWAYLGKVTAQRTLPRSFYVFPRLKNRPKRWCIVGAYSEVGSDFDWESMSYQPPAGIFPYWFWKIGFSIWMAAGLKSLDLIV